MIKIKTRSELALRSRELELRQKTRAFAKFMVLLQDQVLYARKRQIADHFYADGLLRQVLMAWHQYRVANHDEI